MCLSHKMSQKRLSQRFFSSPLPLRDSEKVLLPDVSPTGRTFRNAGACDVGYAASYRSYVQKRWCLRRRIRRLLQVVRSETLVLATSDTPPPTGLTFRNAGACDVRYAAS